MLVFNKLHPYSTCLILDHPFALPNMILERVSLDTDSNSSFVSLSTDKNHTKQVNICFDSLADVIFINEKKYRCVWDAAVIKYEEQIGTINSKYVETSVSILNEKTFDYIHKAKNLYESLNRIKLGKGSFDDILPLDSILAVSYIANTPCVLDPINIINRGQSILDVMSIEQIDNFSYKRYINKNSLNKTKSEPHMLLALKPKKKKSAKSILVTRKVSDIVTLLPILEDIKLSFI